MKKTLLCMLILALICTFSFTCTAYASSTGTVSVSKCTATTTGVSVEGTTTNVKAAVFVQVRSGSEILASESFVVTDGAFSGTISKLNLVAGTTYDVWVADYDGGAWTKTTATVEQSKVVINDKPTQEPLPGEDKISLEDVKKAFEEQEYIKVSQVEITFEISPEASEAIISKADGKDVRLIVEKTTTENKVTIDMYIANFEGVKISDFDDGEVKVTVPITDTMAKKNLVCLYINDKDIASKVKGKKNADKTFTFITCHNSTYEIVAEEEATKILNEQKEDVKELLSNVNLKVSTTLTAKKNIKVTAKVSKGKESLTKLKNLGYTVEYKYYRSTKKASKYQAKVTTKEGKSYTNTSGKKGTRYYYKARIVIKDVNGQQVAISALSKSTYGTRIWNK